MDLLKKLCEIRATSGDEFPVKEFLKDYLLQHQQSWAVQPEVIDLPEFQNGMIWSFGQPKTAIYVHLDSIGYTVRYHNQLVPIGGPHNEEGDVLVGSDVHGEVEGVIHFDEDGNAHLIFEREVERGTTLTYKPNFIESDDFVQCCYMDNRLGLYVALQLAQTMQNGLLVFSCWEEHGGGSVPVLTKYLYDRFAIRQALICDITWVTEGVEHGKGVAISMRDRLVPRKVFIDKIIQLAKQSKIPFQLEVEGAGSSDAREIQASAYGIDWCFIGAPENNVHTPREIVHKADIQSMIALYHYLLNNL